MRRRVYCWVVERTPVSMDLFQVAASRFGIRAMSVLRTDFVNLS
jgi:hypothetical protein